MGFWLAFLDRRQAGGVMSAYVSYFFWFWRDGMDSAVRVCD